MSTNRFEFIKQLPSGSFGEVWIARDLGLDSECVVKCIAQDKIVNQKNFFHEAHTLKAAEHPNIVKVFGSDILPDGRIYISMEFLKKGSLKDEARGLHVPLRRAKAVMIDVLRGLEHAHSKGIIHRDIKPANILIGNSREGKLSDFGLSLYNISPSDYDRIQDEKYPKHLAPEVRSIGDYSVASDIYACGLTLYRVVNGDSYLPDIPFESRRDAIEKGHFPNRDKYREFVPRSLKNLINKALNLNPAQRFATAEEMRHSLEQIRIQVNWNEGIISEGIKWSAGLTTKKCYVVERIRVKTGSYKVCAKKGTSKHSLRCMKGLSFNDLPEKKAVFETKRILQGFVSGDIS